MSHPFTKAAVNTFSNGPRTMTATSTGVDGEETTYELEAHLPIINPADPNFNMVRSVVEEQPKPSRTRTPRARKNSGTVEE